MASKVDIANLALSHLGDDATVISIDPPEGSAQAAHCARFYPLAVDSLLEMHPWSFATTRLTPAQVASPSAQWDYAYALPNNVINVQAVLPSDASDDYAANLRRPYDYGASNIVGAQYVPAKFTVESNALGQPIVLTDQESAILRVTVRVTDTTRFSPAFVQALSWNLAAMLAGPLLKGDVGAAEAKRCMAMMQSWLMKAQQSDAMNSVTDRTQHVVSWLQGR